MGWFATFTMAKRTESSVTKQYAIALTGSRLARYQPLLPVSRVILNDVPEVFSDP